MTDPIADMLTRIRNAQAVRKVEVMIPHSKLKIRLAEILKQEGYVNAVETIKTGNLSEIKVGLKYDNNAGVIREIKRISKPGHRVYVGSKEIPHVLNGLGLAVLSTSQGLMTNTEARQKKLGGELLCEIY